MISFLGPVVCAPRHFRSRLTTTRPLSFAVLGRRVKWTDFEVGLYFVLWTLLAILHGSNFPADGKNPFLFDVKVVGISLFDKLQLKTRLFEVLGDLLRREKSKIDFRFDA